jgi:hypothetical protein
MNNLQKAKEELETSIANAMEALKIISEAEKNGAQVAKWEPKGGCYFIDLSGNVYRSTSTHQSRSFGAERETKEQAEHAAEWMRKFNRLLCWFEENAPGHLIGIEFDSASVSIKFLDASGAIDDLRTKIRDGVVEL